MKGRIFAALNPFGPLSPLHPANPLNPLRSVAEGRRRPPLGDLDDSHDSVLKKTHVGPADLLSAYGRSDRLPRSFSISSEIWRHSIEGIVLDSKGNDVSLSIVVTQRIHRVPLAGWVVQASVIAKDRSTGGTWKMHGSGALRDGECGFAGDLGSIRCERDGVDWKGDLELRDGTSELQLDFCYGPVAYLGDPEEPLGWADNNPSGVVPHWVSGRSRFGAVHGSFSVPGGTNYEIARDRSVVSFEHRSFHGDVGEGVPSMATAAELAITRPQCLCYRSRVMLDPKGRCPPLDLLAYEVRNGHSGQVMKRFAALTDSEGRAAIADPPTIRFARPSAPARGGDVAILPDLRFEVPGIAGLDDDDPWRLKGTRLELDFASAPSDALTVRYPVATGLAHDVHTTFGGLRRRQSDQPVAGAATREVWDLLRSGAIQF